MTIKSAGFTERTMKIYQQLTRVEKLAQTGKVTTELSQSLEALSKDVDSLAQDQLAKTKGLYKSQIDLCKKKLAAMHNLLQTEPLPPSSNSSSSSSSSTSSISLRSPLVLFSKAEQEELSGECIQLLDKLTIIEERLQGIDFEKAPYEVPLSFQPLEVEVNALKKYLVSDSTLQKSIQPCLQKCSAVRSMIDSLHFQMIESISVEIDNYIRNASALESSEILSQSLASRKTLTRLKLACVMLNAIKKAEETERRLDRVISICSGDDEKHPKNTNNVTTTSSSSFSPLSNIENSSVDGEASDEEDAAVMEHLRRTNPEAYLTAGGDPYGVVFGMPPAPNTSSSSSLG